MLLKPRGTADLGERAAFYARCGLLEDLAYGSQTGLNAYTDKSLAALQWLFLGVDPVGMREVAPVPA